MALNALRSELSPSKHRSLTGRCQQMLRQAYDLLSAVEDELEDDWTEE
jgi:hypothetical protein